MVNPDWSRVSTKSILASFRYGMLIRSTTSLTPNCSSETSPSATSSSRYIAYRRPEQPPGWTATRSAISARPSCSRSCLTLFAAISLRVIIGPFPHAKSLCRLYPPGVAPPGWPRDWPVATSGAGMPERRRPTDGVPGRVSGFLRVGPADCLGAQQAGQALLIGPVGTGGERQKRPTGGHEHERLHEPSDLAADGSGSIGRRLGPFGEPPDLQRHAQVGGRSVESLDRASHEAFPLRQAGQPLRPRDPPGASGSAPWPTLGRTDRPARRPARQRGRRASAR